MQIDKMYLKFKLQFGQFGDYDCDDDLSSGQTASKALVEIPINLGLFRESIDTQMFAIIRMTLELYSDRISPRNTSKSLS